MMVSIRKSKMQKEEMTLQQLKYAALCAGDYMINEYDYEKTYHGVRSNSEFSCDVYRTKTQISAVVYFK